MGGRSNEKGKKREGGWEGGGRFEREEKRRREVMREKRGEPDRERGN